jgi:hypothetical protein
VRVISPFRAVIPRCRDVTRSRERQRRASGSAGVGGAQLSHVLQSVHDLLLLLRGHRLGFIDGVLRDVLQLAEATTHPGQAVCGHAVVGRTLVRCSARRRLSSSRCSLKRDQISAPVPTGQGSCQVLECTTPALGTRSRSRSAYASARSRTPAGLLPTLGADLMIAWRTASRACSLRL